MLPQNRFSGSQLRLRPREVPQLRQTGLSPIDRPPVVRRMYLIMRKAKELSKAHPGEDHAPVFLCLEADGSSWRVDNELDRETVYSAGLLPHLKAVERTEDAIRN